MCSVKTPKPQTADTKPVQYLSNVWLDGSGNNVIGRNNLRMDLGSQPPARLPVTTTDPNTGTQNTSLPAGGSGAVTPATGGLGIGTARRTLNVNAYLM